MGEKIKQAFANANRAVETIDQAIAELTEYRDRATSKIAQYLRSQGNVELDVDAIFATTTRPYTLLPISEHEAWLIHWRGVKMPIFGWVVAQEPAFLKAKVTRSMDLLTPLPLWMKDELGWKPPEHQAIIDGTHTSIHVTGGDDASFKRKYGKHLGVKQSDGSFKIHGGDAWINLVAALVKDGILPYQAKPVHGTYINEQARLNENLLQVLESLDWHNKRPYLERSVREFFEKGAVLFNFPPGAGKTLAACMILNYFTGSVLLLVDSTMLVDQWNEALALFAPQAKVVVSTYQGAQKYAKEKVNLLIADEAQRLPANTFSKLAFIQTDYRLGLTATPWREDDRQHLVVALSGFPIHVPWAELIAAGVLRRPRVLVATVANDAAKTGYVKSLLSKRKGRAIIYCDWIEQGQALANALGVPFIHGGTSNKLERVRESDVCVVSRVGDRGLSLRDLTLVVEVAGAGKSREQLAQRLGRLLHGQFEGTFVTVFTPDELAKFRGRLYGVEAELAGQVDIEFIQVGSAMAATEKKARPLTRIAKKVERANAEPLDEITETFALPAVAARIQKAKSVSPRESVRFVERVLRYCWNRELSARDIADGLGLTGVNIATTINSACKAAVQAELMVVDAIGRYSVNHEIIDRLRRLSEIR